MTTSASGQTWASFGSGTTRGTAMRLPAASSSSRSQPSTREEGVVGAGRDAGGPTPGGSSNTCFTPVGKACVIVAGTMRRSVSSDHTGMSRSPDAASSPMETSAPVSARSTRASPVRHPLSRRSASIGRLSARSSSWRLSWDRATTGVSSSRARILSPRLISDTSTWRFSALPRPVMSWR